MKKLKEKLKNLPKKPGVYQFKDKNGGVIYIGKAKNLKARVNQYFSGHDDRGQIPFLMAEATDIDYTVVNNELESLYLENTLIKQHLPKYNILLRDDKNYAFIEINYSTQIPQIQIVRKVDPPTSYKLKAKSYFFGPYSAAYKIRNTLNLARKIFPYCSAKKIGNRPCFYYYLRRCPGVCIGKISLDEYKQQLNRISHFLAGDTSKIKKDLEAEMKLASHKHQFEKAARFRDQLNSLKLLEERQTAILAKKVDWDVVSVGLDQGFACVNLFKVRGGKLFDKENFVYEANISQRHSEALAEESQSGKEILHSVQDDAKTEVMQKFLEQYYLETSDVPSVIYTQIPVENPELIEHLVRSRFGRKIKILSPQKGKPLELVKLAVINAEEYLKNWLSSQAGHLDKINSALSQLKEVLGLPAIPDRIECYDISNIQGANAVGSMAVFEKGLPKKSDYRKFKIKTKSAPDDYAMMKEMLARRFSRLSPPAKEGGTARGGVVSGLQNSPTTSPRQRGTPPRAGRDKTAWPIPDLIVIDGGKGQLNAALAALKISNSQFLISKQIPDSRFQKDNQRVNIPIIGLAKRIEEIFIPGQKDPIVLSRDNPALQLLQRLRDEAHRFGIAFHRQIRSKQAVKSALDDILGIGPKTKKLLKQKFGTVANIRKAKFDELVAVAGQRIAQLIRKGL